MKKEKLESKFFLLILVIICVLILLSAFSWFQGSLKENVSRINYEIMQEIARQQLFNFETKIQGQLNQLQLYARSYEKVDMNDYNAVKELINVTEGAGSFHTISIADGTGRLISNNNTAAGNILLKQYYKDAISGNAAIGLKYSDDGNEILELIYAVPIYQGEAVNGVLVGSELRSDVNDYLMTDSFGGLGASFITDSEGNIILSSGNGAEMVGNMTNYRDYFAAANADGIFGQTENSANVYRADIGGSNYIIIRNDVDFNGWSHILQVDALFINSQSTRISNSVLILLLAVLVSVCAVIAVLFRVQAWATRMRTKAERDLLTDLLNKKTFESDVESMLSDNSANEVGALLIIDLDNFKAVNDTLGHMAGDRVLSGVADKIRETFRQQDLLGRIGGDEFAVYMKFGSRQEADERYEIIRSRAELLCRKIRELTDDPDHGVTVSCSIGIALDTKHDATYDQLYKRADEALYRVKKSGKNRFDFYTDQTVSEAEGGTRE